MKVFQCLTGLREVRALTQRSRIYERNGREPKLAQNFTNEVVISQMICQTLLDSFWKFEWSPPWFMLSMMWKTKREFVMLTELLKSETDAANQAYHQCEGKGIITHHSPDGCTAIINRLTEWLHLSQQRLAA